MHMHTYVHLYNFNKLCEDAYIHIYECISSLYT